MFKFLDVDFETRSKEPISVGSAKYAQHPSTEILLVSFQRWDSPLLMNYSPYGLRCSERLNERSLRELTKYFNQVADAPNKYKVRAHHSEFEYWIYNEVGVKQFGWPPLPIEAFYCTMTISGANAYPASEEKAGKAMNLDHQKDAEGKRLIQMFSCPSRKKGELFKSPFDYREDFNHFGDYCDDDVRTQRGIVAHCNALNEFQEKVFFLTEKMNIRGIPIDVELAQGAIELAEKYKERANKRINKITKGCIESATQTTALTEWLNQARKAKIPNLKAATIERVLQRKKLDPVVREVLELRSNVSKSSTAKYVKAINMCARGNLVHGSLKAYLTATGRHAGRALQIQNFSKPNGKLFPGWHNYDIEYLCELIIEGDIDAIEQAFGDVMEVLKGTTRSMIKAPPGYRFMTADYSQVEARIVMWLSRCKQGLKDFDGDGKIYEKMAGTVFNVDYTDIIKGTWQRDLGKEAVLGCGFGMGKEKFYQTCIGKGLTVTKKVSDSAVDGYRMRYPDVPQAWKDCEAAAIDAIRCKGRTIKVLGGRLKYKYVKNALRCELPSGRFIYYPEAKIAYEHNQFGGESLQIFYKNWKDERGVGKQWDFTTIWGGILFQHGVQAIAADLIANGLLTVEEHGYDVIFAVHDEGVSLVKKNYGSVEEYERLLCIVEPWARGIPLVAEGWAGTRYKK